MGDGGGDGTTLAIASAGAMRFLLPLSAADAADFD